MLPHHIHHQTGLAVLCAGHASIFQYFLAASRDKMPAPIQGPATDQGTESNHRMLELCSGTVSECLW
jgi:hypothetical protein